MSARSATAAEVAATLGVAEGAVPALERLILTLADSKRLMGIRYSDWLLGSPSIETGIACSSMAQDEWGHARLLYAMLKELGHDPVAVEHDRADAEYANVDALDSQPESWAGLVALSALVDAAITLRLADFGEGTFELARGRVPKMLAEEDLHRDFGQAWFRRLARGTEEARAELRRESLRVLPRTLAWLASDDALTRELAASGLTGGHETRMTRYAEAIGPLLEGLHIDLASVTPDASGWDAGRGRGPGGPQDDSLERARGDRNRDLFVE
ncbi:MAG: Phenylacetic acid catabolic protein [Gemmatimonadota bacterium]